MRRIARFGDRLVTAIGRALWASAPYYGVPIGLRPLGPIPRPAIHIRERRSETDQ